VNAIGKAQQTPATARTVAGAMARPTLRGNNDMTNTTAPAQSGVKETIQSYAVSPEGDGR
jgi:hypothetical protein